MHRLYVLPTLIINAAIIAIPALLTVALAFFQWDGISTPVFVGLANFTDLLDDSVFWTALGNNVVWTLIFLTVPIAFGLLAATMMLIARRGSTFFQVIYFLPVIIATAITGRIWQGMIYSPITGSPVFYSDMALTSATRSARRRKPSTASPSSISGTGGDFSA